MGIHDYVGGEAWVEVTKQCIFAQEGFDPIKLFLAFICPAELFVLLCQLSEMRSLYRQAWYKFCVVYDMVYEMVYDRTDRYIILKSSSLNVT